ncbi:olfactory receptor 11A1-like [Cheilinus undulatus]|uniref:olfactory receptor 11A1-like n=1 Tax=Cheilinus undulatus TaxID=241271 RepID=UPI001BD38AE1|nr:olfactory receptor 11A1-like [Cheilinus undulatus]
MNSTHYSYIRLGAYFDAKSLNYLLFLIVLLIYLTILCANLLLIILICVNRSLHEPMYVFLCSLFVNELYGSTGVFPLLLVQILSDSHTVYRPICFLQIFCVYSYVGIELFNLAVISYDRYLAICFPLQYNTRMTTAKIALLIAVAWIVSLLLVAGTASLSSPLRLCGNVIANVFCNNYSIVKLACSDTSVNNIYGLFITAFLVCTPLFLILYTYIRIFKVCFSGSKQTRQKAVSTCTPHLASLINFSCGIIFEVVQSRFDNIPTLLPVFFSLYLLTCQPLLNPVMYGLKMSKILNVCKSLFCSKVSVTQLQRRV